MTKIKAYIKSPTGEVFAVDVKDYNYNNNGMVAIISEDDITYATHAINVLLVESEVKDDEKTDNKT